MADLDDALRRTEEEATTTTPATTTSQTEKEQEALGKQTPSLLTTLGGFFQSTAVDTDAERMADAAAQDAGWQIPWPRLRMMSQSPDLTRTTASNGESARQTTRGGSSQQQQQGKTAWAQLQKLLSEVTEVFGGSSKQQQSDGDKSEDSGLLTQQRRANVGDEDVMILDEEEQFRRITEMQTAGMLGFAPSFVGGSGSGSSAGAVAATAASEAPSSNGRPSETAVHRRPGGSLCLAVIEFSRNHPLLALVLGWLAMVFVDWFLTSAAVPRLVSWVTARPWSPFSESFVLRTSVMLPELVDDDAGLRMMLRRRILSSELWIDDFVWRIQMYMSSTLVPMTRPYAIQWLFFGLFSLRVLKRCSAAGYRVVLVYAGFFIVSDMVLWRVLGPGSASHSQYFAEQHLAAYTAPSYECRDDACRVVTGLTTPPPPPTTLMVPTYSMDHQSDTYMCSGSWDKLGLCSKPDSTDVTSAKADSEPADATLLTGAAADSGLPRNIRSPFADAVEEALERKRAMVVRRSERMRRLHEWRTNMLSPPMSDNDGTDDNDDDMDGEGISQARKGSRLLPVMATLSVYVVLVWQARGLSWQAVQLVALLLMLDIVLRNGYASVGGCASACSKPIRDSGSYMVDSVGAVSKCSLWTRAFWNAEQKAAFAVVSYIWEVVAGAFRLCRCLLVGGGGGGSSGGTSPAAMTLFPACSGASCLLPIHAISMFALLALREAGYVVHNARAWYATVVRERRRGPYIMTKAAGHGTRRITVTSELSMATAASDAEGDANDNHGGVGRRTDPGSKAAYAKRICFLCLSGYCERCLLSMEIWPTGSPAGTHHHYHPGQGETGGSSGGGSNSGGHKREGSISGSDHGSSNVRRKGARGLANGGGSGGGGGSAGTGKGGKPAPVIIPSTDPLAVEPANGLPPLRDSLLSLGLLNPALNAPTVPLLTSASGNKRGKALDAWVVSSVAHCPCRSVHGVGPSAFVSRTAAAVRQDKQHEFSSPVGTLLPLVQYVRELKSLGLVRPVDPASVVFADEDPASSVLPLIFGRFTVPENPRAVAAANALLASSATSYAQLAQPTSNGHTPGSMPFIGAPSAPGGGSGGGGYGSGSADNGGQVSHRPTRILVKPTPLSSVRAPHAGTFRLCLEDIRPQEGVLRMSVVVTPVLAHLLLAHPRTASTASVCVPASLVSAVAARSRALHNASLPFAKPPVSSATATDSADPQLDYARVQLARSDVVVRVDGVRWADVELGASLNHAMLVRGLAINATYSVCVTVCGMRSEELRVVLPSAESVLAKEQRAEQTLQALYAGRLEEVERARAAAGQRLRKLKREAPKQITHWEGELESVRRAIVRQSQAEQRFRKRQGQLEETIGVLSAEVEELRGALRDAEILEEDDDEGGGMANDDTDSTVVAQRLPAGVFGVLSVLDDESLETTPENSPKHSRRTSSSSSTASGSAVVVRAQLAQALSQLRHVEHLAKRAQDMHEDTLQELKQERAKWIAALSKVNQKIEPAGRALEPVRRDIREVAKRIVSGKATQGKLEKQARQLGDGGDASGDAASALTDRLVKIREAMAKEQLMIQQLSTGCLQ